jgi:hypothetical protein
MAERQTAKWKETSSRVSWENDNREILITEREKKKEKERERE